MFYFNIHWGSREACHARPKECRQAEIRPRVDSVRQQILSSGDAPKTVMPMQSRTVIDLAIPSLLDVESPTCLHKHFLVPNEFNPRAVIPHFKQSDGGLHLSVGTERFFSNAALCPYQREGFIGIDCDSHVKAYNDFNIFLLRVSEDQAQYCQLATLPEPEKWQERMGQLQDKINAGQFSCELQRYYKHHLESFARIFYPAKCLFMRSLSTPFGMELLDYHNRDKEAFAKLQMLARSGKLISLCRDINALEVFSPQSVAEIDISNIHDYSWLDFRWEPSSAQYPAVPVRVIWTRGIGHGSNAIAATKFFSFDYTALDAAGRDQLELLKGKMKQMGIDSIVGQVACARIPFHGNTVERNLSNLRQPVFVSYSRESWALFEDYARHYLFGNEAIGFFDTYHWTWPQTVNRLNAVSDELLERYLQQGEVPKGFVKKLIEDQTSQLHLKPSLYALFVATTKRNE